MSEDWTSSGRPPQVPGKPLAYQPFDQELQRSDTTLMQDRLRGMRLEEDFREANDPYYRAARRSDDLRAQAESDAGRYARPPVPQTQQYVARTPPLSPRRSATLDASPAARQSASPRQVTRKAVPVDDLYADRPYAPSSFDNFIPDPARLEAVRRKRGDVPRPSRMSTASLASIASARQDLPAIPPNVAHRAPSPVRSLHMEDLPTPDQLRREMMQAQRQVRTPSPQNSGRTSGARGSPALGSPAALEAHPSLRPELRHARRGSRSPRLSHSPSSVRSFDSLSSPGSPISHASGDEYVERIDSPDPLPGAWPAHASRAPVGDQPRRGYNIEATPPALQWPDARLLPATPQQPALHQPSPIGPTEVPMRPAIRDIAKHPVRPASPLKEGDILCSVKHLPERPIHCPPWSNEEKHRPSSFAKTSKLKVKVVLGGETFVAGAEVFGHVQVSSDEGLRAKLGNYEVLVGEIGVELVAYEEADRTSDGHEQRSVAFLYGKRVFQRQAEVHPLRAGDEQIVTSAVVHDPPPDGDGFWQPVKGTTSFPFAFALPRDCPSSADFGLARVRYVATAYVHCKLQGSIETVAQSASVRVCEFWDKANPAYTRPIGGSAGRDIANYEEVFVEAKLSKALFTTGDKLTGAVRIRNHAKSKVREVKLTVVNRITFFADRRPLPDAPAPTSRGRSGDEKSDGERRGSLQGGPGGYAGPREDLSYEVADVVVTEPKALSRGDEETWPFTIELPRSASVLSVRNLALFEAAPQLVVKVSRGALHKTTKLRLPAFAVAASASLLDRHAQPRSTDVWPAAGASNKPGTPGPPCEPYTFSRMTNGVRSQNVERGRCDVVQPMYYLDARQRIRILDPSFG